MKFMRIAVAALFAFAFGNAYAFHSGGVAECEGCHSMHNSFEGSPNVTGRAFAAGTGPYLLKANDQSGACLNCHAAADTGPSSYHIATLGVNPADSTTPVEATPGGDFAWLKKTLTITIRKSTLIREGERFGHNVIAADFGYVADDVVTAAPGGTYPAANLGCQSCHDPHGRYRRFADGSQQTTGLPIFASGSYNSSINPTAGVSAVGVYRILGGAGYAPASYPTVPFTTGAPDAVVASCYYRLELSGSAVSQTGIAYGQNMSEWCANCHTDILQNSYSSGVAGQRHPAGNSAQLTAAVVTAYNAYVSSGIMTNTGPSFSTLAPFENGTNNYAQLKSWAVTAASSNHPNASTGANVACVSCHRAHASPFESALRFFYLNEFMTIADASNAAIYDSSLTENKINFGLTGAQQQTAYYGRPATVFGPYARGYCNKCHAKD